jgi:predicted ATP-binding protein involved in virulence
LHLTKIEITDFRSIDFAKIENIDRSVTLIGANNEGKTNVLKAIRLGLSSLENIQYNQVTRQSGTLRVRRRADDESYNWLYDFPVSKQSTKKDQPTVIRLEFDLSPEEIQSFYSTFDIKINGKIPVVLRFSRKGLDVDIPKQGKGKPGIQKNLTEIAEWVSERVNFTYVPAIRTSENAQQIIAGLIQKAIRQAEQPILEKVEDELAAARSEAILGVEAQLAKTLKMFVPAVQSISVRDMSPNRRLPNRSEYLIEVDDGIATPIFQKGDGIQSLATLALMRSQGPTGSVETSSIVAIEEPEAHLHSDAIHQVRTVISEQLPNTQVFIATHSPIFVQRRKLGSNIIVRSSSAQPATSLAEIRDVLGVRAPDNLNSAAVALLMEGRTDCDFFRKNICRTDSFLAEKIDSGELLLVDIDGAGNAEFYCRHYAGLSCEVFAFLDNDTSGRQSAENAIEKGFLSNSNTAFYTHSLRSSVDLEDLASAVHQKQALVKFGYTTDEEFESSKANFSSRVRSLAKRSGKACARKTLHEIKLDVCSRSTKAGTIEDKTAKENTEKFLSGIEKFFT